MARPELWREVVGLEGRLEVSDTGRVRTVGRTDRLGRKVAGRVLAPHRCGQYRRARLWIDGRGTERTVHIMVLEAFIGPRPDGMHACHNDGDTDNNALSNLRWDTASANAKDQFRHGTAAGARNFKGATGMKRADGTVSEAAAAYQGRRRCTPEERRAANRASQRAYRLRQKALALAITWHDLHGTPGTPKEGL